MGVKRSPTAAAVAEDIAKEKGLDIIMSYEGIDDVADSIHDRKQHYSKYDKIFVMERYMQDRLVNWGVETKIVCLNIEDIYSKFDSRLIKRLRDKLKDEIG